MNDKLNNNVTIIPPFKKFCMTIGELPSSYTESMTYYESLVWLCNYIGNTLIPAINNNGEAVTELQEKYIELKNYVDNYFENLDIQEEINNKLDDMAESGELVEIISAYLEISSILGFDTKADLKAADNLINGSITRTLGTTTYDDGYGYYYRIRELEESDVIDEDQLVALTNYPLLVAEKIINYNAIADIARDAISEDIIEETVLNFDVVSDMKLSTDLVDGSIVRTTGYRTSNDGGSALYKIREKTNADIADEMFLIALADNSLIGELIVQEPLNPKCIGAYGDGTHDDLSYLQAAINRYNVLLSSGTYYVSDMINVPSKRIFDGANNTLKPAASKYAIGVIARTGHVNEICIKNIVIDCETNVGSNGVYLESAYFVYVDNINIFKLQGNSTVGIKQVNGFNVIITNSRVYGDDNYTGQIGLQISTDVTYPDVSFTSNMTNNKYENLLLQVLEYGVKAAFSVTSNMNVFDNIGFSNCTYGYHISGNCEPITLKNSRLEYCEYGFYISGGINANIDSFNLWDVEKGITNVNSKLVNITGSVSCTGSNHSPTYKMLNSTNNVINSSATYTMAGNAYGMVNSSGFSESGCFVSSCRGAFIESSATSLNADSSKTLTYIISSSIDNIFGTKGSELYVYTTVSDLKIKGTGTSVTNLGAEVTLTPYRMYHVMFVDGNKFIIEE